jgi:peptide/nickel transport system substrate-binding protein
MVLAACGGSDSDSTEEPETTTEATDAPDTSEPATESTLVEVTIAPEVELEPQFGGTLRYAIEADSDGLNPTQNNIAASGYVILNAVFDTLASYDADNNAVADLAESFTPNDDYTQWEVKLREGVLFHDGTPLNAERSSPTSARCVHRLCRLSQ